MAERKVLEDAIGIGWPEEFGLSQRPAAAGILGLEQVAAPCTAEQDFPPACYLEPFGYRFSGLNAFGSPHKFCFLLSPSRRISRQISFEFESLSSHEVQLISEHSG